MKTDRVRLSYTDLRRRADAYQHMVQTRIHRLLREAGVEPAQLTRSSNGRWTLQGALPSDPVRKAKVCLARILANNRLYAAHANLALLVAKGRTDLNPTQPTATQQASGVTPHGAHRQASTYH